MRSYYSLIQAKDKRRQMSALYGDESLFTVQHETNVKNLVGSSQISGWLAEVLPQIQFRIVKWDAQPLPNNAVLLSVQGQVRLGQQPSPKLFSQSFTLLKRPTSTIDNPRYYCHNDILQIYQPVSIDF